MAQIRAHREPEADRVLEGLRLAWWGPQAVLAAAGQLPAAWGGPDGRQAWAARQLVVKVLILPPLQPLQFQMSTWAFSQG